MVETFISSSRDEHNKYWHKEFKIIITTSFFSGATSICWTQPFARRCSRLIYLQLLVSNFGYSVQRDLTERRRSNVFVIFIHLWYLQELLSLENHLHKFISETLLFVFVPFLSNLGFENFRSCKPSLHVHMLEKS